MKKILLSLLSVFMVIGLFSSCDKLSTMSGKSGIHLSTAEGMDKAFAMLTEKFQDKQITELGFMATDDMSDELTHVHIEFNDNGRKMKQSYYVVTQWDDAITDKPQYKNPEKLRPYSLEDIKKLINIDLYNKMIEEIKSIAKEQDMKLSDEFYLNNVSIHFDENFDSWTAFYNIHAKEDGNTLKKQGGKLVNEYLQIDFKVKENGEIELMP